MLSPRPRRRIDAGQELIFGLVMAVALTAYLVYAMLRPEQFLDEPELLHA
jgi:K+-transporting ATPase KdpF subunit